MKSFGVFCLVWMLLLSVWPCGDTETFEMGQQENHLASKKQNTAEEDCSPMCACVCCRAAVDDLTRIAFKLQAPQLNTAQSDFSYNESALSVHFDIWQPPKLG